MTRRELVIELTDGRRVVDRDTERDDPCGRSTIAKRAMVMLERADVARVWTRPVTRVAGGRRGTYR